MRNDAIQLVLVVVAIVTLGVAIYKTWNRRFSSFAAASNALALTKALDEMSTEKVEPDELLVRRELRKELTRHGYFHSMIYAASINSRVTHFEALSYIVAAPCVFAALLMTNPDSLDIRFYATCCLVGLLLMGAFSYYKMSRDTEIRRKLTGKYVREFYQRRGRPIDTEDDSRTEEE